MKKAIAISTSTVIIIGAAYAYFTFMAPSASDSKLSPQTLPPNQSTNTSEPSTVAGSYVTYKDQATIMATSGTKLLFFHAPWCPQCRALENDIKGATLPENLTIFKVDYDTSQQLRQKYGVTIQTTLVKVGDDGELIKKYVAYDEPTFTNVKQNLLD